MVIGAYKTKMVPREKALPGRSEEMAVPERHYVHNTPLKGPWPEGSELAYFGMGCFWGAERLFWQLDGVYSTAVGYMGGYTPNPTYEEVCSARTGHTEAVQVVYDPTKISYADLLVTFWENHDPTQGMRQGNDVGTQYRSALYVSNAAQARQAEASRNAYQQRLYERGHEEITTEIRDLTEAGPFFYAEAYHQQYLAKNPHGYCGLAGTGVPCPGS